jgi:RNA polymerase sigma-70 factor (ECF subfamily)
LIEKDIHIQTELQEDENLIRKSQVDPEAFRALYEKYFKRIFLFVHHRVGEKSLSADLTSQVFLKALLSIGKFQFRGLPFSAWLYRIAINECHEFFRKHKRYRMIAIDDESVGQLYDEMIGDNGLEELHSRLPQIMELLDEEELLIIELRYFEQRPFKEVAEIIGISEVNAKVRVYRVLDKMKKLFRKA